MAKKEKQENKKPVLVLDDKEYHYDNLEEDQKVMVAHINDLNRKIDGTTFNLQQLQYGRQAFINSLKESLEKEKEEES
ncbi:MAG: hypothetical protein GOVbin4580_4 [Prokaryotic dsDNA virus sp.]|jgi:hypothetical protein|nr:MAG: hypothetical protein GOVbin4580_4 [Prokaryotic dsDNA virus sp.]|tara:strand:+ start:46 stop:279 length:234 start_codon:yes stop_codon:yes gene_type:complete